MNLTRAFIALSLPWQVQKHLGGIISRLKDAHADINWVEPGNTHLTLKFLGEISPVQLRSARDALSQQNGKHKIIICRTGQIGAFPGWSRPQVIWLGFSRGVNGISAFQRTMENELAARGFARDPKKFAPHLTLGRVRSRESIAGFGEKMKAEPLVEIEFGFGEMALFQSTLTPEGPVYRALETIKLA
jgi:RNA 2',3'-cyclic 3'-phosphodiesterase